MARVTVPRAEGGLVPRSDHASRTRPTGAGRPLSSRLTTAALVLGVFAVFLCAGSPAWAAGPNEITGVPTPFADIHSAGPLEDVYVGNDLSCQIKREGKLQVYSGIPGDCGTFVSYGGVLYTPDFEDHKGEEYEEENEEGEMEVFGGGLESSATPYDSKANVTEAEVEAAPAAEHDEAFKTISQSPVEGSGTTQSPYVVTTVVQAGEKLRLTQTDSYVVGNDYYTVGVQVENLSGATLPVQLYRGQDCYLGGEDRGYGVVKGATSECTSTANNEPAGFVEALVPAASPASEYLEAQYLANWEAIGTRQPLADTCDCETFEDNADAVGWSLNIAAGEAAAVSVTHVFSENGELPEPPPSPSKPSVLTPPSVSGSESPTVGATVSAETGTYGDAESYEYQWQLCPTSEASSCTNIEGATATQYTPNAGDAGSYLRFLVTAVNGNGSSQASSALIGPIGAAELTLTFPVTTTQRTTQTTTSSAPAASPAVCSSTRSETIHWKSAKSVHLAKIVIAVNGKVYRRMPGDARSLTVSLAGRGQGEVVVAITGTSRSGGHYRASRTYRPCITGGGSGAMLKTEFLRR
jgi:hypothetical protein